ncbi:MAG TPA: glycerol-3-phosphate 1-O-acyltransferase PlsY [Stellaceae bacterium]|jgi:glycerol-3-phosphate acyltransferase PlsY|nr:glycerol-3-phosphate 1-O-acyltransferase PlsY [Stellaceae bacterium]
MTIWHGDGGAIIACAVFAYLCGSIPFGLIFARLGGHGDIRDIGSGNIGATNVLRTGNKHLALATLACDIAKGFIPVLIARQFGADAATVAAIAAPLGHIFPLWLRFKGGKGVATAAGALLAYAWPIGVAAVLTWLAMAIVFRYSSLAAVTAAAIAALYAWIMRPEGVAPLPILFIALIIIWRHRTNLSRLLHGDEDKIALRKTRA